VKKENWRIVAIIFIAIGIAFWCGSAFAVPENNIDSGYSFTETLDEPIFVDNLIITSLDPEDLDQEQSELTGNYAIGTDPGGYGFWIMQRGMNDRGPFTGFQLALGEHGTTTEPLYVGVMYGENDPTNWDNWKVIAQLDPGVLPEKDTLYWLGLDLEPDTLPIYPGQNWYLLAISMDSPADDNFWMWGASENNPYPRGTVKAYDGDDWNEIPGHTLLDMCFRTYTIEGEDPVDDPPDITITTTAQVVAQALGSISFIGALVSGIRYFKV
jgi:hypothetical protein